MYILHVLLEKEICINYIYCILNQKLCKIIDKILIFFKSFSSLYINMDIQQTKRHR